MICPNCKKSNRCNCTTCNPDKIPFGTIITLDGCYKCFWCQFEFSPDESLNVEWKIMTDNILDDISREYVMMWILDGNNPQNWSDFELKVASYEHLRVHPNYVTQEMKNGFERELKIQKILKSD